MNVTAGLLLIFLNVFLPGLIFLRFYYTGEFSKQFSTKIPVIRLAFYALIPGLIFLLFGVFIYNLCDENFTLFNAISIFSELLGSPKEYSCQTECFLKNQIDIYSWFTLVLNAFAFISAIFLHWLVRRMEWHIDYKLLRFKNQWYYVFNGDILKYKKYRALNVINPNESKNGDVMMAYADILVSEAGATQLYSGIVVDYDLDLNDNGSLDKIYLMDAHRHKRNPHEKKAIPGQIFVILNSNILNINLTFVPSPFHKINQEIRKGLKQNRFKRLLQMFELPSLFAFIYFTVALFVKKIAFGFISYLQTEFNVFEKIFLSATILVVLSQIFYDEESKQKDRTKFLQARKGTLIILGIECLILAIHYLF